MESPERWEQISEIAANAIDLLDAEREAYLDTSCAGDSTLREQVLRLVSAGQASFVRLDQPLVRGDLLRRALSENRGLVEGDILGKRYRIVRHIGAGGMGDVYEAWDLSLESRVALKTVRPEFARDEAIVERFKREVQLARQVTHENVCRVYDLGLMERGQEGVQVFCLTMELIEGQTLAELMKSHGPWTYAGALPVLEQVCLGLKAAHQAGVIHRDLKPANIMLVRAEDPEKPWHVVVTDFGLAHSNQEDASSWTQRMRPGTPAYMAPEQLEGKAVGPQADLYALGGVMYEMATGQAPWQGDSPLEVAFLRLNEPVPAPSQWNPSIDVSWERIILRLLEKEPGDRYGSAEALLLDLKNSPRRRLPLRKLWRRVDWRWAAVIGFIVLAACGALYWDRVRSKSTPEALRWLRQGEEAIENRSWLTAKDLLDRAVAASPQNVKVLTRLAQVHLELDQTQRAQQMLLSALGESGAEPADAEFREALRAGLVKDWPAATAAMERRVKMAPPAEQSRARFDLIWLLEKSGKVKDARGHLEALLKTEPGHAGANLALGILLYRDAKAQEGEAAMRKAEESYRLLGNAEGLATVAVERTEAVVGKDRGGAVFPLIEATEKQVRDSLSSRSPAGLYSLDARLKVLKAQTYSYQAKHELALTTARSAFESGSASLIGGGYIKGLLALARGWIQTERFPEAIEVLTKAREHAARQECTSCLATANYYHGYLLSVQQNCAAASEKLQLAAAQFDGLEDRGNQFRARNAEAACYRRAADYERAEKMMAAIERDAAPFAVPDIKSTLMRERYAMAAQRGDRVSSETLLTQLEDEHRRTQATTLWHQDLIDHSHQRLLSGKLAEARESLGRAAAQLGPDEARLKQHAAMVDALIDCDMGRAPAAQAKLDAASNAYQLTGKQMMLDQTEMACEISIAGSGPERIAKYCEPVWAKMDAHPELGFLRILGGYSRAHYYIGHREPTEALRWVDVAYAQATKDQHKQNELYAALVGFEAAAMGTDAQSKTLWRERAVKARRQLEEKLGEGAFTTFWRRATYSGRWANLERTK